MSLLVLFREDSSYLASPHASAFFYAQLIPAYEMGTIEADELYSMAVYDTPIVRLGYWNSRWKGGERINKCKLI